MFQEKALLTQQLAEQTSLAKPPPQLNFWVVVKLLNEPSLRRLEERCAELEVGLESACSM